MRRAIVGRSPHDLINCVNKEALLLNHSRRPASSAASINPNVSTSFNSLAAAMPSFGSSIADGLSFCRLLKSIVFMMMTVRFFAYAINSYCRVVIFAEQLNGLKSGKSLFKNAV